jgi:uncharacterized protein (TIGR02284 family)
METITSKETAGVLNDLVNINNDRIAGYEKALKELTPEDADLKPLFLNNIDQSRKFRQVLGNELQILGGAIDTDASQYGSIYKAWMEVKAVFSGHNRHTILSNCEYGEDAAQKAYETAMKSEYIPAYLQDTVLKEKEQLKKVHDEIKALRDRSTGKN